VKENNMSTRGAWGWRIHGTDTAVYNHWDSYPAELGIAVLSYLRMEIKNDNLHGFEQELFDLERVTNYTLEHRYEQNKSREEHPSLDEVTLLICSGKYKPYTEFLYNSLFCEWAYIFNFDAKLLEVYRGFNKNPEARGRFANTIKKPDSDYYGVKLVEAWSFDELPTDEEFIRILGEY
jgi:hypothetical protein